MCVVSILDDEPKAGRLLESLISQHIPTVREIHLYTDPISALLKIPQDRPDLLLLDIRMPQQSGFEFLSKIENPSFAVIFVTAFDQYAIQAMRLSAVDYLLKPIDPDELQAAFRRYFIKQETGDQLCNTQNAIKNIDELDQDLMRIHIAGTDGIDFIPVHEIIRCEARINYTVFHLANGKRKMSSKTLKEYVKLLLPHHFIRVHKTHLLNSRYIKKVVNRSSVELSDGAIIPIARRRKEEVFQILMVN